jgi:hypothetical protein
MAFIEKIIDGQVHYINENYDKIMEEKKKRELENPPHILDISPEEFGIIVENDKRRASNEENKKYLSDTDWYVTRLQETGKAIPEEVLQKRQEARDSILPILDLS